MKYGIVYAYWSKDWEGEYIPTIERAAKCGFNVLEIFTPMLLTVSKKKLDEMKAAAIANGIELSFLAGLGKEHDVSSEDAKIRENGIDYVKQLLEVVHYLGGTCFSGINYCAWSDFNGSEKKEQRLQYSIRSLKELGRVSQEYGISYNLEVTNRFENFLLNTSKEAVDFVKQVDIPSVNILLDAFHMNIEEDSFYEAIIGAGDKLGHFHVGENNRVNPFGSSMMAWDQIGKGLKEIGYNKTITLEPLVKIGGSVSRDSKIWRDMTNNADDKKMDEDAMAGLAFMKNLLRK